jgi:hypothetical protein
VIPAWPPKVVCSKEFKPQAITSARSATIIIIAGGNATGNHIPPYYIFPGQRWNDAFLNDAAPGSDGEMSVTGWSNTAICCIYFSKAQICQGQVAVLCGYCVGVERTRTLCFFAQLVQVILMWERCPS